MTTSVQSCRLVVTGSTSLSLPMVTSCVDGCAFTNETEPFAVHPGGATARMSPEALGTYVVPHPASRKTTTPLLMPGTLRKTSRVTRCEPPDGRPATLSRRLARARRCHPGACAARRGRRVSRVGAAIPAAGVRAALAHARAERPHRDG